jgi:DNA-binding NarL/FixJ family response regulator
LAEAEELGRVWLDRAARERRPLGVTWFSVHLARCALTQGRVATARDLAERACAAAQAGGYEGLTPISHALLAVAQALLGDAAAEAARHIPVAAWLLHDAARLGAGRAAAARLQFVTGLTDSVLVAVRAEHAAALVEDDAERLVGSGDRFEALGAILLAAEATAAAADSWRRRQDQRRANALHLRSLELAAQCESATTPGLIRVGTVGPLTAREREVAMLAAAGPSSRAIAERLYLSMRTVDTI